MKRVLAIVLVLGWSGAAMETVSGQQTRPAAGPVQMCLATAADFSPVYPTRIFPATSTGVCAALEIAPDATFKTVTGIYIAADVPDAAPPNTEITRVSLAVEPGKRARLRYTQDKPMPPGQYRLDVLADSQPWQSVEFTVRSARDEPPEDRPPTQWLPLADGTFWIYEFLGVSG